jgi:hypothetical protein
MSGPVRTNLSDRRTLSSGARAPDPEARQSAETGTSDGAGASAR